MSDVPSVCTCSDPAVACQSCLARRDQSGWPKDWRERMREFQWNALEMARKVEQAERRAEDAEAEVERLRSLLAKVQRVFDLQCPPMLPSKYDDRGAWMAHAWWDKVLGPVLQQVTACEWCAQQDGHANGCRLGRGPDEGECEHHWLDRPESDTRECLICGVEGNGPGPLL